MEGREREGPKLLLNQGPSEPCYATATNIICRYVQLLVQELSIKVEVGFLLSLLSVFKHSEPDDRREFELSLRKFLRDVESTRVSLITEAKHSQLQMQAHLYDYIHLTPIKVSDGQ